MWSFVGGGEKKRKRKKEKKNHVCPTTCTPHSKAEGLEKLVNA